MTCGLIVRRWLINYRLTEETRYENPPLITPNFFFFLLGMWKLLLTNLQAADLTFEQDEWPLRTVNSL